ncbi:MAG TPA: hypothetical protein DCY74_05000 [Clostridiales bacterium]|nr:hypothetical protein [Clostridiales bacterium]HCG36422.1 hypothetical protein [Clostridiales bacterium]
MLGFGMDVQTYQTDSLKTFYELFPVMPSHGIILCVLGGMVLLSISVAWVVAQKRFPQYR